MRTVSFTQLRDITKEDDEILTAAEEEYQKGYPKRLLNAVKALDGSSLGFQVTRYEHSLQSATRAYRNNESEEYIVAALLHDIGDDFSPLNHGEMVAAILKPYVSEKICWIIKYHPLFQTYYYAHLTGGDPNARDRHKTSPYYQATVDFCEHYDQNCFDPNYDSLPLDFFEPMVRRVFAEPRYFTDTE